MGYATQSIGKKVAYTPVYTGFSVDPAGGYAHYSVNGEMVTVHVQPASNGTSNATTTTITLPFPAAGVQVEILAIANNGTQAVGRLVTAAGSNVASVFSTVTGSAWTASGNKIIQISGFTYFRQL